MAQEFFFFYMSCNLNIIMIKNINLVALNFDRTQRETALLVLKHFGDGNFQTYRKVEIKCKLSIHVSGWPESLFGYGICCSIKFLVKMKNRFLNYT